ncbi:MAG: HAMP domain-containing sensor histidine kinase [Syntrophales bacterium]|nr:HAMP domain-containing sensor histidine kinase [Syntrophales bacterium]
MKFGIFPRLTAGYLVVLFLLGASNVYAILKLVQFNTLILNSYNEDIRLLDSEKKIVDSLFSQRRFEQKYILTKDTILYNQFLSAKEDFERTLAELNTIPVSPTQNDSFKIITESHQRYHFLVEAEVKNLKNNRNYNGNWYKIEKEKAADTILEEVKKLDEFSRKAFYNKTKIVSDAGALARTVAVISFMIAVLLVILLSLLITRSITNPLLKLVKKTRDIQRGIFDCNLDVSAPPEIKELTESFNLMCNRLKEVDKIKTNFFAMISHELRTPITTIKEGASLLIEGTCGSTTEKQSRLLTIIAAESNRLTSLVNSILDLSKMEAGMMEYNFENRSIEPLVEQVIDEITPYAEAKKIHVGNLLDTDLPSCRMDSERILDVLRNLVGNAVKFTPEKGQISIMANLRNGALEVSVCDSGPGIPKEKLSIIFEKYESSDQKKGTGLGLAIVEHIVTAHGGKVWAESDPGQGSRFIFVLPS